MGRSTETGAGGLMGDVALARQLENRGIRDRRVLQAIASLSRADFIPAHLSHEACADHPLPIGLGQTISQPYIVAFMTEALRLSGVERVLEIGTGSGYQTALLARLCHQVYSIELLQSLSQTAAERHRRLGIQNVQLRVGDGYFGWPEAMPFQRILLTAAPSEVPPPLLAQLGSGGILLAPIGPHEESQELVRIEKHENGKIQVDKLLPVRFVPMHVQGGSA